MRDRFPLLLAGGVLLLGTLAWFLMQGAARGGFADRLSTFRSEPDGARALYLLAQESGLNVTRQQQDLTLIAPKRNLVMLGTRFADERDEFKPAIDGPQHDGGVDGAGCGVICWMTCSAEGSFDSGAVWGPACVGAG